MKMKYILLIFIVILSFMYTDKVVDYSKINNTILTSIEEYSKENNKYCIEGKINELGIILSFDGKIVDKNKSYSNMKGNLFNAKQIEYKEDECILNKENNLDKYIISGNEIENNISIVIDVTNKKYYQNMIEIFNKNQVQYNILVNDNYDGIYTKNILYKGTNIKDFSKKYENIYCVQYKEDILEECKNKKINSIKIINYIDDNLYQNIKKLLNKGNIYFIKESKKNLIDLDITIKYINNPLFYLYFLCTRKPIHICTYLLLHCFHHKLIHFSQKLFYILLVFAFLYHF